MQRTKFHYDPVTDRYLTQDGRTMQEAGVRPAALQSKTPLSLTEHLLCLVVTVLTAGLFLPVWLYLASRGHHAHAGS